MHLSSDPTPNWEARFLAPRLSLPNGAEDAPDRCVLTATVDGVTEIHSWDGPAGLWAQTTGRTEGTALATIDPSGEWIWWFDDTDGDEFGIWRRQPFGSGPATKALDATGLPAAYPAGLAIGRTGLAIVACSDDEYGSQIWAVDAFDDAIGTVPTRRLLYSHREDAGVGPLSDDETLVALSHSEHGDARHPALRVLRVADGAAVAELWDGTGKGLEPHDFCPIPGDQRLAVIHERRGRQEVLIWDVSTGLQSELDLELDGEVSEVEWYPEGDALLVCVDHHARTRAYRVTLEPRQVELVSPEHGSVLEAAARPGGRTWLLWSSAAEPPTVIDQGGALVLSAPGPVAPGSVAVEDVWVQGAGGPIHILLRRPAPSQAATSPAGTKPAPLIFDVHGGPTWHDPDAFGAYVSAWVDHGFAVAQVNYRGSTGYGSAWRDANEGAVGRIELEDVVAARDHLVAIGVADPERIVLQGASWGGYLTLLGLGLYPDRWAAGIAAVPVADYVAAYQDEAESLKAFDRSLFGGSPDEVPEAYAQANPLNYIDAVGVPVLLLAGVNDPRCPLRQIENYVAALAARGGVHEVYRFEAGHGSLVDAERIKQTRVELDFIARHLAPDKT